MANEVKTGWKPDFTKASPYEGMPQEYVELEAAAYKPTPAQPLPPSQRTPGGIAAREVAPAVSKEVASIKLAPRSRPDKPLFDKESYDAFQKLQDEQKFVKLQELGTIEKGAKYAPGLKITYGKDVPAKARKLKPREWGVYSPEQAAAIEKAEAEAKASKAKIDDALSQLKPYKTAEGYELQRAFDEGKGADVYAAKALGLFTDEDIVASHMGAVEARAVARKVAAEAKAKAKEVAEAKEESIAGFVATDKLIAEQQAIIKEFDPYKIEGGYNVLQYLIDNPTREAEDKLLAAGFSKEDIRQVLLPPEVIAKPEDTRDFIEKFNDAVIAVEDIAWQALTPWEEEKGESFVDYVKATPKRLLSPDTPDQAILKTTYNDEQAAPLWARLLFGDTVAYDKKNDQYVEIYLAVAPERKTAAVRAAQRVLTKTIEVNYNKLLKPKIIKPQINWNNITSAIKSGQIRTASQAAKWARLRSAAQITATKTQQALRVKSMGAAAAKAQLAEKMRLAIEAAAKASQLTALSNTTVMAVPSTGAVIDWRPFHPSQLSAVRMKELTTQWLAMEPSKAIRQINAANLVTAAVAYEPVAINKILLSATPAQLHQTISRLQPNTQEAIRTGNLTKARQLAQTQLQVANQQATATAQALATATQAATEAMVKALAEGATLTEAQTIAQVAAQTATQTSTASEAASQTATQIATQTLLRQATQTATQTAIKPLVAPIIKVPITKKPSALEPLVPVPPPILLSGKKDKEAMKLTKAEQKTAVSWPQGFGWWVVFTRKGRQYSFFHHGQKPPQGIKQVTQGAGEAARGIQRHKGVAPVSFKFGMGAVAVSVEQPEREPGKAGAISFKPTRISSGTPRITPRRPPIR